MNRSPEGLSRHNVNRDQSGCLLEDEILSYAFDDFPLFRRANTEDEIFLHTLFVENRSSDLLRLLLAPADLDFLLKMHNGALSPRCPPGYWPADTHEDAQCHARVLR
jgi:hypothetical protein